MPLPPFPLPLILIGTFGSDGIGELLPPVEDGAFLGVIVSNPSIGLSLSITGGTGGCGPCGPPPPPPFITMS